MLAPQHLLRAEILGTSKQHTLDNSTKRLKTYMQAKTRRERSARGVETADDFSRCYLRQTLTGTFRLRFSVYTMSFEHTLR